MNVAYFSPLSPIKSGISKYSEVHLLPFLQKYAEIDTIIDEGYNPNNEFIKKNLKVKSYKKFNKTQYDIILYHVGNNPHHEYIYNSLLQYPGVVVLHDPFISGLIWNLTITRKKPELYIEQMVYCLGEKGRKIAENAINSNNYPSFKYTLTKRLIDSSIAIIVHSNYAKKIINSESPEAFIKKIKMPILLNESKTLAKKEDFGINENTLVISTFGYIAEHKRLDVVLDVFVMFLEKNPNSRFMLVGKFLENHYKEKINERIKKLGLTKKIIQTDFVEDLDPYIEISDIIIQTRFPTAGETSIITLEIMGKSKPVIVSNTGWFEELPDNTVIKIDVDSNEKKSILTAFEKLASDKEFKNNLIVNAKKYVKEEHDPEKIASEFYEFLSHIENVEQSKYIDDLSMKLHEIGFHESDHLYIDNLTKSIHDILS